MGDCFDAKDTLAFGIDLQCQLAAMQFEDRQIIRRSLDRDFPFSRSSFSGAIFRTGLITENGFDGLKIQRCPTAIDQSLKHLVHPMANLEDEVAAVFDLVIRILIVKSAP